MGRLDRKHWFADAAVFVLPLIFVKAAGVMFDVTAPAGADAAAITTAQDAFQFQPDVFIDSGATNDDPSPAAEYAAELRNRAFGDSPMWYEMPQIRAPETDAGNESEPQADASTANLHLKMIMTSSTGNTALINDNPYRIGDVINGTQWAVTAIDGAERSVTVKDQQSGRVVVISVNNPGR